MNRVTVVELPHDSVTLQAHLRLGVGVLLGLNHHTARVGLEQAQWSAGTLLLEGGRSRVGRRAQAPDL